MRYANQGQGYQFVRTLCCIVALTQIAAPSCVCANTEVLANGRPVDPAAAQHSLPVPLILCQSHQLRHLLGMPVVPITPNSGSKGLLLSRWIWLQLQGRLHAYYPCCCHWLLVVVVLLLLLSLSSSRR